MLLESGENRLELNIEGYQFPTLDRITDWHDANWLMISGKVHSVDGAWTFLNACMLTTDLLDLIQWLRDGVRGEITEPTLSFMEPLLTFEYVSREENEAEVCVSFELEARPPWLDVAAVGDDVYAVNFRVPTLVLEEAASDLEQQRLRYPERPGR